jgi:hypothetical protein
VVNQWPSDNESGSNLDLLGLGDVSTMFSPCLRSKIRPIISTADISPLNPVESGNFAQIVLDTRHGLIG